MSKTKFVKDLELQLSQLRGEFAHRTRQVETLIEDNEALSAANGKLREIETRMNTTLAGRLLAKGANFICVEADEPYFLEVYRTVRQNAKRRGSWTDACETRFKEQVSFWMDREVVKEK